MMKVVPSLVKSALLCGFGAVGVNAFRPSAPVSLLRTRMDHQTGSCGKRKDRARGDASASTNVSHRGLACQMPSARGITSVSASSLPQDSLSLKVWVQLYIDYAPAGTGTKVQLGPDTDAYDLAEQVVQMWKDDVRCPRVHAWNDEQLASPLSPDIKIDRTVHGGATLDHAIRVAALTPNKRTFMRTSE
jgi:hypothetical protein